MVRNPKQLTMLLPISVNKNIETKKGKSGADNREPNPAKSKGARYEQIKESLRGKGLVKSST